MDCSSMLSPGCGTNHFLLADNIRKRHITTAPHQPARKRHNYKQEYFFTPGRNTTCSKALTFHHHHEQQQQQYPIIKCWEKELEEKLADKPGFWELLDQIAREEHGGVPEPPAEVLRLQKKDAQVSKELQEKMDFFMFAINSYRNADGNFDDAGNQGWFIRLVDGIINIIMSSFPSGSFNLEIIVFFSF